MVVRWTIAVIVASLVAVVPSARAVGCRAQYEMRNGGEVVGPFPPVPSTVTLDGASADLAGWCRVDGFHLKTMRRGLRMRKRVRNCGPLGAAALRLFASPTCNGVTVTVTLRRKGAKPVMMFSGIRHVPPGTFHVIADRVFAERGCSVSTCHGSSQAGHLDLRPGAAYASLVGVAPDNGPARDAGMLRVAAGDVAKSFLSAKLHGTLAEGQGDPMPRGGPALPDVAVALVDAWIAAGAPESGAVDGAPDLPPLTYEETPPLPPPPGGFQLVLDGPVLEPGHEQEGCLWVASPTPVDVPIGKIEIALNPGTHHFVVWQHDGGAAPPLGTWLWNDVACLGSGGNFGQQIAGAPHAPYYTIEQPPGFASLLPGGVYFGLNAHYYNESSGPIAMKAWVNFYPYEGTPEHVVRLLPFDLSASNGIDVPPYTTATVHGRFVNASGKTIHLMGLGGHMHKRGVRFSIRTSDGTKVLDDYDWAHPSYAPFDPPHALPPGDWIDFECLHDNGVDRPVRLDQSGNPMTIRFGTSAEDEMCILTGQYYDD